MEKLGGIRRRWGCVRKTTYFGFIITVIFIFELHLSLIDYLSKKKIILTDAEELTQAAIVCVLKVVSHYYQKVRSS